jgi:hypothetical protein
MQSSADAYETPASDELRASASARSKIAALLHPAGTGCATTRASGGLEVRAGARAV